MYHTRVSYPQQNLCALTQINAQRLKLDVKARARKRTAGYKCCFSYFNFDEHVEQIASLIRVKTEKACRHRILFTDTVRNT